MFPNSIQFIHYFLLIFPQHMLRFSLVVIDGATNSDGTRLDDDGGAMVVIFIGEGEEGDDMTMTC